MAAALIMEFPDGDEPEDWFLWGLFKGVEFNLGTMPLIRELVSFNKNFKPVAPIHSAASAGVRLTQEIDAMIEGRQSLFKAGIDIGKIGASVVITPGSGQALRVLDYTESYMQGGEGDTYNPYEALVKGKSYD